MDLIIIQLQSFVLGAFVLAFMMDLCQCQRFTQLFLLDKNKMFATCNLDVAMNNENPIEIMFAIR
jgi:hypothetical protein